MVCLILARGGSKGVPQKNIKELNGVPLIGYVIEAAKKTSNINEIYVSTDCQDIKKISLSYGVKIIDRPSELCQDNSLDIDAFKHFCNVTNINSPIVHLRATTPLIKPHILDDAISEFEKNKHLVTSLRSGHEMSESAYKFFIKKRGLWYPIVENMDQNNPRQSYPKTYVPNGYIDIVKPEIFMNGDNLYGEKIYSYVTNLTQEIDTIEDFEYIEYLIKNKKYV